MSMRKLVGTIVELIKDCDAIEVVPRRGRRVTFYRGQHLRVFTQKGALAEAYVVGRPAIYLIPVECLVDIRTGIA